MQTNSIKQLEDGTFKAKIQCDASDKRPVSLPNGNTISTTCYLAGEFEILAVPLQPFLGEWKYAFRKKRDLAPDDLAQLRGGGSAMPACDAGSHNVAAGGTGLRICFG